MKWLGANKKTRKMEAVEEVLGELLRGEITDPMNRR